MLPEYSGDATTRNWSVFFWIGLIGIIATGLMVGMGGDNYWVLSSLWTKPSMPRSVKGRNTWSAPRHCSVSASSPGTRTPARTPSRRRVSTARSRCRAYRRLRDRGFDRTLVRLHVADQDALDPLLHAHLSRRHLTRHVELLGGGGPDGLW